MIHMKSSKKNMIQKYVFMISHCSFPSPQILILTIFNISIHTQTHYCKLLSCRMKCHLCDSVCVFVEKRVCAVLCLSVWFAGTVCCWESESSCWWSDRTLIWTSRNNTWMTLWSPQLSVCLLVTVLADISRVFSTYAMSCIKVFINPGFTRARHVLI